MIIPSLLGSTPYNHQPTRVLNIARFYPNYIALIYTYRYYIMSVWNSFFWSTTLASYNFSSLGLGQAPAPLPSPGRHQGKPSILHYLVVYLLIVVPQHNLSTTFFVPLCMCVRQLNDVEWKLVSTFSLGHVHLAPRQVLPYFLVLFWCTLLVPTSAKRDIPINNTYYLYLHVPLFIRSPLNP